MTTIPPTSVAPIKAAPTRDVAAPESQPLDRARLDQLREAIQSGKYPLDPGKLAARMLDLRETLGK